MCIPGTANSRYINFYTDFAFKKFFGTEENKDLLISFLNCLLDRKGETEIKDVKYLNTEQLGAGKDERRAVYDVYCMTQNGERFIVEMQNAWQDNFSDRALYYSSFAIQKQGERGGKLVGWDYRLTPVYVVGILNFTINDNPEYKDDIITIVELKDRHNNVFNENLKLIFLEMTKFQKEEENLETTMDKWLFAMKNMCRLNEKPSTLKEPIFNRLFEVAKVQSFTDAERLSYEESLKNILDMQSVINSSENKGIEKGIEIGRAEGRAEGEFAMLSKMVVSMSHKGKTPSEIADILEVELAVVEEILNGRG